MARTIALTGVTGFIGQMLAHYLQGADWHVRALIRPGSGAKLDPSTPIAERVEGSLEDPESLGRLLQSAHGVIHCAGAVRGATQADFDKINVEGVARLARIAAQQDPPPRFLLLSSLAAREPQLSHYAASKRRGEEVLASVAGDMPWIALRPPAVYGPGDKEMLPLFRLAARGIGPILAPANAHASLLYVEDLAEAIVHWLRGNDTDRDTFELHDGHEGGYSWNDVMDTIARICDKRILRLALPSFILKSVAIISLGVARATGKAPMLTPGKVRELRHHDWVCDNTAWHRATGWTPRFPLEEGLRRTPGWRTHAT